MKHFILSSLFLTSALSACSPSASTTPTATPQTASVAQTASTKKATGLWLDVRTPEEFQQGHIQDAVNLPVEQVVSQITQIAPDKNAPINVYCRSGHRAGIALEELKKMGYTNVSNHGAYDDLVKQGIR